MDVLAGIFKTINGVIFPFKPITYLAPNTFGHFFLRR